jgi:hypothetical protein
MTGGAGGIFPWSSFMDTREFAPELRWPQSIPTLLRMQTSDAQLKGLLLATMLPIRRLRWEVDPNGARPEVVDHIADSLGLPVVGQDPPPSRRRGRFNHDQHLAHALRALGYGHFYFEQVYEYRDPAEGGDGRLHLHKLGTRPPRTIAEILTEDDGGLKGIKQNIAVDTTLQAKLLDVNRLVAYIWDSQDDGDWIGTSIMRSCFRNWLVKDRLIRVDATKHERNAMGIPWFKVDPNASQAQIKALAKTAQAMRAGSEAGGAGPGDLKLAGVEGQLPDTIASIRYHDQQMSRAFLLLFYDLGTTQTGSRALGGDFIDWYADAQDSIAAWYRDTTQAYQVEDEVELNWGPDEQPPLLTFSRMEATEMTIQDLVVGVSSGLIALDDEMRSYVMRRWHLPKGAASPVAQVPPPATAPAKTVPLTQQEAPPAGQRSAMASRIVAACQVPMRWPDLARAAGTDPKNGTARRARDELLEAGAIIRREGSLLAPVAELELPDRDLRRQPYPQEIDAKVDYAAMDATFVDQRAALVAAVKSAQGAQIDALVSAVEAANGNTSKLAALSCDPVDASLLEPHLQAAATAGTNAAKAERAEQLGAQASAPKMTAAEADTAKITKAVEEIAAAVATTLAAGLSAAASRRAVAVAALPPADAATKVRAFLSGLSDAALNTELGGAAMHAYGTGRREFIRVNSPDAVYASELLDENTCGPCGDVDGSEYATVVESEGDYPWGGGYVDCDGGLRCRGTIIATYS